MESNFPAFESHGGKLEAYDDGHIPETFQEEQSKNDDALCSSTPRIVRYDAAVSTAEPVVYIYDGILNPNSTRMLYEVTATSSTIPTQQDKDIKQINTDGAPTLLQGESPWGTYVTIQEALEWIEWKDLKGNCLSEHYTNDNNCSNFKEYLIAWRQYLIRFRKWQELSNKQSTDEKKEENIDTTNTDGSDIYRQVEDMDYIRHSLAVEAVSKFFLQTIPNEDQTGQTKIGKSSKDTTTLFQSSEFLKQAHGVAVWALSSNTGNSVQYHIDYGELLRYEYNVTVPPLYAGTIQCSQLWNDQKRPNTNQNQTMKGGEFCVNLRGLDHYSEHGYKGNISGDSSGGWRRPEKNDNTDQCPKGIHTNDNTQWVTIPYAFNRGIVHRGDLPHLSAPVESITTDKNNSSLSRVIVGFNVFGHDVGELISKAPEHSKTFRRKVRMYRSTINTCKPKQSKNDGNKPKQTGMDISQIRKNKGLTKLLILAKREKVKQELRRNQEQLSCKIWNRLLLKNHADKNGQLLTVADIVHEFGSINDDIDGSWPKSIDVHVHLHHLLLSTKSTQDVSQQQNKSLMHNHFQDSDGLVGTPGAWYYMQTTAVSSQTKQMDEKSKLIPLTTLLDITRV